MKRGVVTFTKPEVEEIYTRIDLQKYASKPLGSKLAAAYNTNEVEIPMEVSEEELEQILDEIIIPDPSDTEATRSLRKKIQSMLEGFRESGNPSI